MRLPSLEQKIGPLKLWQWALGGGLLVLLHKNHLVNIWTPHWGIGGIGGAGVQDMGVGVVGGGIGGYGDGWGCDEDGYCGGGGGGGDQGGGGAMGGGGHKKHHGGGGGGGMGWY